METKELIEWLRGYAVGVSAVGNRAGADMILMAANRIEGLDKRARIAEAQRNQAWDELARIKGEFEHERLSRD